MPTTKRDFSEKFGWDNKRAFFEAVACIKVLKLGYGEIKNGFTVPKKGKELEFNGVIFDTLKKNNAIENI